MKDVLCLGIESTAHTFSIAVVDNKGRILSNIIDQYTTEKGGIIPQDAAKHHESVKENVLKEALTKAKVKPNEIDFISVASGPGLAPCLLVGVKFAKNLAKELSKPLIPVNHIAAHLEIGKLLTKAKDPIFVFVSGANTQIINYKNKRYRILGEALSISLGNALDKFGREINLGFPAGPKVEQLAEKGKYIKLPYVVKGMDVEFSGIVTAALNLYKKGVKKEDLCYSLQEILFSMLTEVTERALAFTNKNEVLLIGGVAANQRLCSMLSIMCEDREAKFFVVPKEYSGDQAAQAAWLGTLQYNPKKELKDFDISPKWRIDEIEITWI